MADDAIRLKIDDGIATVILNQPDKRNPINGEMATELNQALSDIRSTPDARCLVVEAAGDCFSAGGDLKQMRDWIQSDPPIDEQIREVEAHPGTSSRTIANIARFQLPTIAKIDGHAIGAGAALALACDVQLASTNATMGFGFRNVGLSVDNGISYFLPRMVGENIALELVLTGERVSAERAETLGLFNHVYPAAEFDTQANEFVSSIAEGPTVALRHSKRLVKDGLENSLESAIADEAVAQGVMFNTDDHAEAVQSFFDGSEPEFRGK